MILLINGGLNYINGILFAYIFLQILVRICSRPFPLPSIEVRTDSIESEKVRRLCRFGQNLPLSERIQPENLFPFTSVQWTPTAAETSD